MEHFIKLSVPNVTTSTAPVAVFLTVASDALFCQMLEQSLEASIEVDILVPQDYLPS